MKIAIDAREFTKDKVTGISNYLLEVLSYLYKYKDSDEIMIFGNQHTVLPDRFKGLKNIIVNESISFLTDQISLPRYLRKEKVDIFFSPYYKVPFKAHCKVASTIHDLNPIHYKEKLFYDYYFYSICKASAKRSDVIITVSEYSKKDIINTLKVPREKVEVVYHTVRPEYYESKDAGQAESVRIKYSIDKRFILYVGNMKPHKNVKGLVKAYSGLSDKVRSEYDLIIIGKKDEYFDSVLFLAKGLGLKDKVKFIDFVEEKDLPYLYSLAEIFVSLSFYEGFGFPVLEAMASGLPVIASNKSSFPEIISDSGVLVDPYDIKKVSFEIEKLIKDQGSRSEMSERGSRRAMDFRYNQPGLKIRNFLKELI